MLLNFNTYILYENYRNNYLKNIGCFHFKSKRRIRNTTTEIRLQFLEIISDYPQVKKNLEMHTYVMHDRMYVYLIDNFNFYCELILSCEIALN